jgi:hypothetical protein
MAPEDLKSIDLKSMGVQVQEIELREATMMT